MDSDLRYYTMKHLKKSFFKNWISSWRITTWLIIINVILFLAYLIVSIFIKPETLISYLALNPINLFGEGYIWTLFTSMFMHAGFFHLLVNMFSLYILGNKLFSFNGQSIGVEDLIGKKRFFMFFIIAGIFAGFFFALLSYFFGYGYIGQNIFGSPNIAAVGASGAIFGLLGITAVLTPKKKIYLLAGPLLAIIIGALIPLFIKSASLANILDIIIMIYFFICLFSMFSFNRTVIKIALPIELSMIILPIVAIVPLILIELIPGIDLPIGNTAHLGGLIAGLIYGFYLKTKYSKKTKVIEKYLS